MSGYLLDLFVQRERVQALKTMVKSWVVFVLLYWDFGDLFICLALCGKKFRSAMLVKCVQRHSKMFANGSLMTFG